MSTGRTNVWDALPRASVLSYFKDFHQHASACLDDPHRDLENVRDAEAAAPQSYATISGGHDVEGAQNDDPHEYASSKRGIEEIVDHQNGPSKPVESQSWALYDFLNMLCCVLIVLIVAVNLDIFVSRKGPDSAIFKWEESSPKASEMLLCLTSQDRIAPTSRIWRYTGLASLNSCSEESITLHIGLKEQWKLLADDEVSFDQDEAIRTSQVNEQQYSGSHAGSEQASDSRDSIRDDLSEEGVLNVWQESA